MKIASVLSVVAALLIGWTDARATSWVTGMVSDSVLVQGIFYPRVTFTVQNQSPSFYVDLITAIPLSSSNPQDTCRIVGAGSSGTWHPSLDSRTGGAVWGTPLQGAIFPGQSLGGFQVILPRDHACLYEMRFVGFFPEPVAVENVCFQCQLPTAISKYTWGALKARYR